MSQIDKAINILIKNDAINSFKLILSKSDKLMKIRNSKNNETFDFKNLLNCKVNFCKEPVHIIREISLERNTYYNEKDRDYFDDKIMPTLNDPDFLEKNPQLFNDHTQIYCYGELSNEELIEAEKKEKAFLDFDEKFNKYGAPLDRYQKLRIGNREIRSKEILKEILSKFDNTLEEGLKGYRKRIKLNFVAEGLIDSKKRYQPGEPPEDYDQDKCNFILSMFPRDDFFEISKWNSPIIDIEVISFEWKEDSYILFFQRNYSSFRKGKPRKVDFDISIDSVDSRPEVFIHKDTKFKLFYNKEEVLAAAFSNPDPITIRNKKRFKDFVFNKDNIKKIKLRDWVKDLKIINEDLDSLLENYRNNEIEDSVEIDLGGFDDKEDRTF